MIPLMVFSDPICPWCYIGKARLGRALEARPGHLFLLEWHPFQLNPNMPPEGMDRREYMQRKFGGKDGAVQAYLPVEEAAREAGLPLDLAAIARTPNTLDAHRLIQWAHLEGRQTPVVSALFRANFAEGRDIGDRAVLAEIANAQGMDGEMVARLLVSEADVDDIRARDADARKRGVRAVPTFVVAGRHVVEGAQPTELWLNVIDEIAGKTAPAPVGGEGPTC